MSDLLIKMNMTSHICPAKNLATLCNLLKMSTYAPSKTLATIPNRYPQFYSASVSRLLRRGPVI